MGKANITQKILILQHEVQFTKDITFLAGTEFEIIGDVVYIRGLLVPPALQELIYNWLVDNMGNLKMFKEDFRRFK